MEHNHFLVADIFIYIFFIGTNASDIQKIEIALTGARTSKPTSLHICECHRKIRLFRSGVMDSWVKKEPHNVQKVNLEFLISTRHCNNLNSKFVRFDLAKSLFLTFL